MSLLAELPSASRIALIRLRSLGDCVLTTPAISLLHAERPDLEIAVVVEPRFAQVFSDHPAVKKVLEPSLGALRRYRASLCLNLHGGTTSMRMTALSGAKWRAGFAHHRYSWVYNVKIPRAQEILGEERVVHTAEHVASAMFHLGVRRREIPRASLYPESGPARPGYAVLHPFASSADKMWPAERFLRLAGMLREEGYRVVISAGPGEDASRFAGYELATNQSIQDLKTLIGGASLFVGNDSGPAHIAAAYGVPMLALFGPSHYEVWRPWKANGEGVRAPGGEMSALSFDAVLEALRRVQVAA